MKKVSDKKREAELPFEIDPIIQRYLEELIDAIREHFLGDGNDDPCYIQKYEWNERETPRAEKNRKAFFGYLEKIGGIWWGSDNETFNDQEPGHIQVRILKSAPILNLLKITETKADKKPAKNKKLSFSRETNTLSYGVEAYHNFHDKEDKESDVFKLFKVLWNRYEDGEGSLGGIALAIQADVIQDRDKYKATGEKKLNQTTDSLNRVFAKKKIPMRVNRGKGNFELISRK